MPCNVVEVAIGAGNARRVKKTCGKSGRNWAFLKQSVKTCLLQCVQSKAKAFCEFRRGRRQKIRKRMPNKAETVR